MDAQGTNADSANAQVGAVLRTVLLVTLFVVAFFPGVIAALGLWYALRSNENLGLRGTDYLFLALGGVAALILGHAGDGSPIIEYFMWWYTDFIRSGPAAFLSMPLIFVGSFVLFWAGVFGMLDVGTVGKHKVPFAKFVRKIPKFLVGRDVDQENPWAPTDAERERVRKVAQTADITALANPSSIASPPGGVPTPRRLVGAARRTPTINPDEILLGFKRDGDPMTLSWDELSVHMGVLGATGSGKTTFLRTLATGALQRDIDVIFLDLKEDLEPGGLKDFTVEYARRTGIPSQWTAISSPTPGSWFSPLAGLSRDAARDALLSIQEDDDNYWASLSRRVLGQAITLVYDAHQVDPDRFPAPELYRISQLLMHPEGLAKASKEMVATVVHRTQRSQEDFGALIRPTPDEQKNARGFGAKLSNFYETEAGRLVLRPSEGKARLDVTAPGLIYIGADASSKPELARVVSSAALLRMAGLVADVTTGVSTAPKRRKMLIIDEANGADPHLIDILLKRARSAGVALVVATQSPIDWRDGADDPWPELSQNFNTAVVMKQTQPEAAELMADYLGKYERELVREALRLGRAVEGLGFRETELDHRVPPEGLRELGRGEAWIRTGHPEVRLEWTQVAKVDLPEDNTAASPSALGSLGSPLAG